MYCVRALQPAPKKEQLVYGAKRGFQRSEAREAMARVVVMSNSRVLMVGIYLVVSCASVTSYCPYTVERGSDSVQSRMYPSGKF